MEWPHSLDVPALLAGGWRPHPFHTFILKIHSRCDLACDHCYVYRSADQSWTDQPPSMSPGTVAQTARRIAEHAAAHRLSAVNLVLHGGEPLLAGPELIALCVRSVREAVGPGVAVHALVQTNGLRLDEAYLRLFGELDLRVGISLDGDEAGHDRHRRRAGGRGSHAEVVEAVRLLARPGHRRLFAGLLCTVDPRNDPVATYEALLREAPPSLDFLLPHGNWSAPPPGRDPGSPAVPYGDWLVTVFDRWYGEQPRRVPVRLFEEIMNLLLGGSSSTESAGLAPIRVAVIETDGAIEQGDSLKSAYHGAARTGLHVATDPLDAALRLPAVVARQLGAEALGAECRACRLHRVCGAGLYAHRYRPGTGFANPSVYCPDLLRLITHIRSVLRRDIAALRAGTS
ncbi:hypothetical protein Misp01_79630 [Microtetraspora sp. NBRC 13810]|uniref:FxsB family cyclophane-forming radical SAM/SPASM peptide maturase n=1 Tax=Microtetraspora sp. NBRC 13810 TaxID=3030990 RepID=UPI0024A57A83|nr:FxsB family cyclophane-forming radical SAM/SPASM peptide maturase [Microtetraspora sp. NBRC 13810]GLW12835.1 hypothetical protein Misp01_79630 [Microtetraspora sp. NBRC 13810]